jgi:VIT1/CCC1 family predicted Fe2+/Mn2+ transporter
MSRFEESRKAYEKNDAQEVARAHEKSRIEAEPWHDISGGRYIKDVIYASSDGIVTTFAIVAGATGASLSPAIIIILGFANLLADGFSMATGNYLGTKSEIEYYKRERERESWEAENMPEVEKEEIRQIFRKKGLTLPLADELAKIVSSNKKVWVDFMMTEELDLTSVEKASPTKNALATFLAFAAAGFMPLFFFALPGVSAFANTFLLSIITTLVSLFIVGAVRVRVTRANWVRSGFEVMLVGGAAAFVAYAMGYVLKLIVR